MTDLAKIGFSADTGPMEQAADSVEKFGDTVEKAGQKVDDAKSKFVGLGSSAKEAGGSFKDIGSSAEQGSSGVKSITSAIDASASAVQKATGFWRSFTDAFKSEFNAALSGAKTNLDGLSTSMGQAGRVTQDIETIVAKTGVSYAAAAKQVAEMATAQTAARESSVAMAAAQSGIAGAIGQATAAKNTNTIAARAMRAEHAAATVSTNELRGAVSALSPALNQLGISMSSLPIGSLRAGIAALVAGGLGGIAVAVAKASDAADLARVRLEGIAGVKLGDEYANNLHKISNEMGVTRTAALPAYEALAKLVNLHAPAGGVQILGPGLPEYMDRTKLSAESLGKAIEGVFQQLRLGGAETPAATAATNKFFESLLKNEALTGDMLRDLEKAAPRAATAIANAMTNGRMNADQYAKVLDKLPEPFQKILEMLPRLQAGSAAAFAEMQKHPVSVAGAVEKLKNTFFDMWEAIDGGTKTRPGALAKGLTAIADAARDATPEIVKFAKAVVIPYIETTIKEAKALYDILKLLGDPEWLKSTSISDWIAEKILKPIDDWLKSTSIADAVLKWGNENIVKPIDEWMKSTSISDAIEKYILKPIDDWLQSTSIADAASKWTEDNITGPIDRWLKSNSISEMLDRNILAPIQSWLSSTSIADAVGAWAQNNIVAPIERAIAAAKSALASMSGAAQSAGGIGGTEGMGMGPYSSSGSGGQSGGILYPSGDAGTIDLGDLGGGDGGGMITDGFASGGSFTVAGDGGTDTTPIAFMATAGEKVDITHGSDESDSPDPSFAAASLAPTIDDPFIDLADTLAENTETQTTAITDHTDKSAQVIVGAIGNQTVILENFWSNLMSKFTASSATVNVGGSGGTSTPSTGSTSTSGTKTDLSDAGLHGIGDGTGLSPAFGLASGLIGGDAGMFAGAAGGAKYRGGGAGKTISGAGGFTTKGGGMEGDDKKKAAAEQQQQQQQQPRPAPTTTAPTATKPRSAPKATSSSGAPVSSGFASETGGVIQVPYTGPLDSMGLPLRDPYSPSGPLAGTSGDPTTLNTAQQYFDQQSAQQSGTPIMQGDPTSLSTAQQYMTGLDPAARAASESAYSRDQGVTTIPTAPPGYYQATDVNGPNATNYNAQPELFPISNNPWDGPPSALPAWPTQGSPEGITIRPVEDAINKQASTLEDIKGVGDQTVDSVTQGADQTSTAVDNAGSRISESVERSMSELGSLMDAGLANLGSTFTDAANGSGPFGDSGDGELGGTGGGGTRFGGGSSGSGSGSGSGSSGGGGSFSTRTGGSSSGGTRSGSGSGSDGSDDGPSGGTYDYGDLGGGDGGFTDGGGAGAYPSGGDPMTAGDYAYPSGGDPMTAGDIAAGYDPGVIDYGGGSSDYGYFADGGRFRVPGSGGIDNQIVTFKARPGEVVDVSPPGSRSGGKGGDINVSIYATDIASFIKSQPQIVAALARSIKEAEKAA